MPNVTKIQTVKFQLNFNTEFLKIFKQILFLETTGAKSVEISIITLLWPKRSLYQEFFSSFKMWRKKNPLN